MKEKEAYHTAKKEETAILIGVVTQHQRLEQAQEYLDELEFLAETAGAKVSGRFLQKLPYSNPRTFLGEGKLLEIAEYITRFETDMVIFDEELSPSQLRNIEKVLNCKILDRSHLILDIFALRAKSAQARYQVALAQAQYLLPRLTRMWTHLSKQKGGIGMKGPGETEIETDRRALRNKISKLKERLALIEKQAETQRKNRDGKVRVSLVGYTNVGKSTLMNVLAKADVFAENKLFATLDSTVRKVSWHNQQFLLSDTVGFIRKLPHTLVACFKSTLDEIKEADLLLHVVDVSHPGFEEQIQVVQETLKEIGVIDKPTLLVFNKVDKLQSDEMEDNSLETLKNTWMAKLDQQAVFISAATGANLQDLRETLFSAIERLKKDYLIDSNL